MLIAKIKDIVGTVDIFPIKSFKRAALSGTVTLTNATGKLLHYSCAGGSKGTDIWLYSGGGEHIYHCVIPYSETS